ncbi:MAG: hypothetical protein GF330_03260 [Candidatus Eisenbacteria bacterium]|nr:hypothetical protein [Candidatus Eisenbacteria bacterium]
MDERTDDPLRSPMRRGDRGMEEGDLEVARRHIERLEQASAEEAVPRLTEVLEVESWYLRERAGTALARFGLEAAPAVERLLHGGLWYTRAAALRVLGRIAAPRSLRKVMGFLRDANQTIAEEAARAVLMFCRRDRALAAAKLLHAMPLTEREASLALMRRLEPDDARRLERLVGASALMGAEGRLSEEEEERLALRISDREWGLDWTAIDPAQSLPQPDRDLVQHLRGAEEA